MPVPRKRSKSKIKTKNQRRNELARARKRRGNLQAMTDMVEYLEKAEQNMKEQ